MNTQREMFQFTAALSEQPEELSLQKDDALQKHLHKRSDIPTATHMNFKWNKPPAGDGSDHRRSFIPSAVGSGVQSSEYLGVSNGKHSWRTIGKAILDSKSSLNHKRYSPLMMQQQQQQQQQHQQQNNKDDDSDESDNTNNSSRAPSKYKRSPHSDSLHSKMSSHSFNEMMNDSMPSYYNLQQKKSSTFMDGDTTLDHSLDPNDTYKSLPNTGNWPHSGKMNFIMLLGLIVGLIISKTLQYLQLYFGWFQSQVLQLRIALLGSISIFDFFNFEDNSRFGLRTKLLLLPVVATFSLLYGTIVFLHHVIRFLLTQAPSGLVNFIQKLYMDF